MSKLNFQEIVLNGLQAAPGIAIGEVYTYRHDQPRFVEQTISPKSIPSELKRLNKSLQTARAQIKLLHDQILKAAGDTAAKIFSAQCDILDDFEYIGSIKTRIELEGINAEAAVYKTTMFFKEQFNALESVFMRQKANDVLDVGNRLIQQLLGTVGGAILSPDKPMILVADDLLPSDVIHLLNGNVLAIATDLGGSTSHTAILTKALEVPAVVGLKTLTLNAVTGQKIIVNGNSGKVILNPSEENVKLYTEKQNRYKEYVLELHSLNIKPSVTLDGREIHLQANIELPQEIKAVQSYGSEGIGLFRSEYLFLTHRRIPDEMEQFEEYRKVVEELSPKVVTIRTFDIGGDKIFPEIPKPPEANPFMGWRAIRVGLDQPILMKTQLRAILRASAFGNVQIMFPFVSGLREIRLLKAILEEAKSELIESNVPFDKRIKAGIMIELPSAVMMSRELAREVDFFSIGTNDLAQFTLAVDRGNELVLKHFRHLHPAILRMIKITVDSAKEAKIPVAICGELAGSPLATLVLVGFGLDELSMSPASIPEVKQIIRSITFEEASIFTEECLKIETSQRLNNYCLDFMRKRFAELPIWINGL